MCLIRTYHSGSIGLPMAFSSCYESEFGFGSNFYAQGCTQGSPDVGDCRTGSVNGPQNASRYCRGLLSLGYRILLPEKRTLQIKICQNISRKLIKSNFFMAHFITYFKQNYIISSLNYKNQQFISLIYIQFNLYLYLNPRAKMYIYI